MKLSSILRPWGASFCALVALASCSSNPADDAAPAPSAAASTVSFGGGNSPCTPGEIRCNAPGATAQNVCRADGSGFELDPCPSGQRCDVGVPGCAPPCDKGAERCRDGKHEVCDQGAFKVVACGQNEACDPGTGACAAIVCTPGDVGCSADFTRAGTCNAVGTDLDGGATCGANEVCSSGACVPSSVPLGDLVWIAKGSTVSLPAGHYAVLAVDATSQAVPRPFPLSVTGDVKATRLARHERRAMQPLRCGTPDVFVPRAPVFAAPPPPPPPLGTTRVFHVTDDAGTTSPRNAVLRGSIDGANLWEDVTASGPGSLLLDTDVQFLLARLEENVLARDTALFGPIPDVDQNGAIDVFYTLAIGNGIAAYVQPYNLFPPGSFGSDGDFGEIVYARPPDSLGGPFGSGVLAHELEHIIYYGRRLAPYLQNPTDLDPTLFGDRYAVEGLSELAFAQSGESYPYNNLMALQYPAKISRQLLFDASYDPDPLVGAIGYGTGGLLFEYLFEQAGAATMSGEGGSVTDDGGRAFVDQFTLGPAGPTRLAAVDGRSFTDVWNDFGAALLVSTLPGKISDALAADTKHVFRPEVVDPAGGPRGAALTYEYVNGKSTPVLERTPWEKRGTTIAGGGFAFLDLSVGEAGAQITCSGVGSRGAVIRHAD